MIVGFFVGSVGLAMMAFEPHGVTAYTWLAISAAVMGIGMGVALPASNNAVLQLAPESTAAVSGLRGMFRQAGGITGLSIVTSVLARSGDPGATQAHVFVVFAVLLLALIPLVFLVPEHRGTW
jgi:MFS family permease